MRRLVLPLVLTACGAPVTPEGDVDTRSCDEGPNQTFVLTSIRFTRPAADGSLNGFDLDGTTTGSGDGSGCGVPDDVDADGNPGIDNAFAKLLPALELTEAQAIEEIVQSTINSGELLFLLGLDGVDSLENDTCATMAIMRAVGIPRVDGQGVITADQTFDVSPEIAVIDAGEITIVDGTFEATGVELNITFTFVGEFIELTLRDGRARATIDADGTISGIMGGGIDVDDVLAVAGNGGIADEVLVVVQSLLGGITDLEPDETGACTRISVSMDIEGVPAFTFADPPGDTGTP